MTERIESETAVALLPCPFCGGAMEEVTDEDGHYFVHPGRKGIDRADCWLCDAWISDEPSGEGSIGEWNTRAPPQPDWESVAKQAKAAADRVTEDARIDPAQLQQVYRTPSQPAASGGVEFPALPDDDADFTPDLARKIIAKYQELLRRHAQSTRMGVLK